MLKRKIKSIIQPCEPILSLVYWGFLFIKQCVLLRDLSEIIKLSCGEVFVWVFSSEISANDLGFSIFEYPVLWSLSSFSKIPGNN